MTKYVSALAKNFASDANVWRKKYVFHFAVAPVWQQGEILLDSLLIHMQSVFRTQSSIYDGVSFRK